MIQDQPTAPGPAAMTTQERVRLHRNRARVVEYADPEDLRRRKRLEKDCAKWLRHYLRDRFPLPFGPVHLLVIRAALHAMRTGSSITAAIARGFGKTTLLWGISLYGTLTGRCRFPVVIGWKATAGAELLDQWLTALSTNDALLVDYPCQCAPFRDSVASNRLKGLLRSVSPEIRVGCDVRKGRLTIILPDVKEPNGHTLPQAALGAASMNGSIKGMNVGLLSGESLRPDIGLLDDPQDEDTAASDKLVAKVIKKIDYGIRSLSGPRRRLTVMAAVTCVEPGDVSEHLLTRPGTEAIRVGQITDWPEGWNDKDSAMRKKWDEWNHERIEGLDNFDGGKRARSYYRKHKKTLTKGMTVSWLHRFTEGGDGRVADPDAKFAAMWDFYDLGEMAFMAERQNKPMKQGVTIYTLNAAAIMARVDEDRAAGVVPEWAKEVICATDVNPSFGLTSVVAAFGSDQRAAVLWYGVHDVTDVDDDDTDSVKKAKIMAHLQAHGKDLAKLPCAPTSWIIDGGGSPQGTVIDFAANSTKSCGIPALCAFGRAWRQYLVKKSDKEFEQIYIRQTDRFNKWAIWNADYWREQAQRSWLGAIGAPGSCDLPVGEHREFATQICREQLSGKALVGKIMVYIWSTASGNHDIGDCMAMLFAMAARAGIGTGGKKAKRSTRKTYTQADLQRGR